MLRYAITDSKCFGDDLPARRRGLIAQAQSLGEAGVDYIQLREKDLNAGEMFVLAEAVADVLKNYRTKLLINSRVDVAVAANAAGVHLTASSDELLPEQVGTVFAIAGSPVPIVSISCHTLEDVRRAREHGADVILFGPVFEKLVRDEVVAEGVGVDALRLACVAAESIPVLALGGITDANMDVCLASGAAGIAGIRLFR